MVFISYATENLDYATELFKRLFKKEYDTWFAPVSIKYGENFAQCIGNALLTSDSKDLSDELRHINDEDMVEERLNHCRQCEAVIFLCSAYSKKSVWCKKEILGACGKNIPILVLKLDKSTDSNDWSWLFLGTQTMSAPTLSSTVFLEVERFLAKHMKSSPSHNVELADHISLRDIQMEIITSGDPYFQEDDTLFCSLSKQEFYLSPPEDMVTEDLKEWRDTHFADHDMIFNETLDYYQQKTGISNLISRIEESRRVVFQNFIDKENGCYYNNKKYGINDINPYERTEDYSECPILKIDFYTTDYYTHRVIKDVCKKLYGEHHSLFNKNMNFGAINKYKILFTSFGINLLLLEGSQRLSERTLITLRSTNCAETEVEKQSMSVIEGVSLSDYDHFQRKVKLNDAAKRGLEEELGVDSGKINNESICFYDLFINLTNLEIGISCTVKLKNNIPMEEILNLHGKDKKLEIRGMSIYNTSDLRDYILANKEFFLPQAICAIGGYIDRFSNHPLFDNETKIYNEERFIKGKNDSDDLCEDLIVDGENFLAVIDGVTTNRGETICGKSFGRFAAEVLAKAIYSMEPSISGINAIRYLNEKLLSAASISNIIGSSKPQASVVIYSKHRKEIWNYGDCCAMINERSFNHHKEIDTVLAQLRAFTIHSYLLHGGDASSLYENDIGRERIVPYLIEQHTFANKDCRYGYPVLGCGEINERFVKVYYVKDGDHIVLASDGYPKLFSSLSESEEYLKRMLEEDPLSINDNMQTKMRGKEAISYDDRAYLSFFVKED